LATTGGHLSASSLCPNLPSRAFFKMAENLPKFRREFKHYKQRKPPPHLSDVIDFEQEETWKGRVPLFVLLVAVFMP
jgi:hypothetical protein